jgi:hypothetical protein
MEELKKKSFWKLFRTRSSATKDGNPVCLTPARREE